MFAYINTDKDNASFAVDGKLVTVTKDMILKENGNIIASANDIVTTLAKGDQVDIDKNVITIVKRASAFANDTVKLIDAIPALEADNSNLAAVKTAIAKARASYDALNADQKALVPAAKVTKLTDAEKAVKAAEDTAALKPATEAVEALEAAVGAGKDLTVKADLEVAEAALATAEKAVAVLPAGTDKTGLEGKVKVAKTTITDARAAFDLKAAEDAITALETATADLSDETKVEAAEALVEPAQKALAKVTGDKTALELRLQIAIDKVEEARAAL